MHVMQTIQTQALVDCLGSGITFIVPIKADLQAHACLSEYHDDDHSLMLIKDARSDGYAPGTLSSEEKGPSNGSWELELTVSLTIVHDQ